MSTQTANDSGTSQDCILVLGMHRSGTSALAGVLSSLGCATPASLIRGDQNNEKGYFESNAVGRLSDRMLDAMGSVWSDWLPLSPEDLPKAQREGFLEEAGATIANDFGDAPLFVLKEPRMLRMVPFWLKALGARGCGVRIVLTHRNPQDVAASLSRRDAFDPAFSYLLWLRHVLDAEHATRGQLRAFTSYRLLLNDWRDAVGGLDGALKLGITDSIDEAQKDVDAFLSPGLQHFRGAPDQTGNNAELPEDVRTTFAILENWAENGENTKDRRTLDRVRKSLNAQAALFAPLVRPGQQAMLDLRTSQAEAASTKSALDETQAAVNRVSGQLEEMEAAFKDQIASIAQQTAKYDALCAIVAGKETDIRRLKDELRDRNQVLKSQARTLDRIRAELAANEAALHGLAADLERETRHIEDLKGENTEMLTALKQAEVNFKMMLDSRSWRLTAPLRTVGRALGRDSEETS